MCKHPIALFLTAVAALPLAAQTASNPLVSSSRGFYGIVRANVLKAAEKMPEENYSYKPTPDVRSFGQIVGHIADAQFHFCAIVSGDQPPSASIEITKTTKADLVQGLKDSNAACDKAYGMITDAQAMEMIKFMGYEAPKITALTVNTAHDDEHYGNLVTYMRLKGIVPPSSEPKK